jgi:hypothetical protein
LDWLKRPLKKGSGRMAQKHVAFAPLSPKQLGSRLRSPILIEEIASSLRSSQRPFSLSHGFFTVQPSPG